MTTKQMMTMNFEGDDGKDDKDKRWSRWWQWRWNSEIMMKWLKCNEKRNETKWNKMKRNAIKRNETKRNETKWKAGSQDQKWETKVKRNMACSHDCKVSTLMIIKIGRISEVIFW